jgi:surface protein
MPLMFYNCLSLTSLDLSSFYTSLVACIGFMFFGSINLEYINLKHFNDKSINLAEPLCFDKIFDEVPNNIVICMNETNVINTIFPQIKNKKCFINDCSDNWKKNQLKFIPENNTCVDFCTNTEYKYEYNGKCYIDCPYGSAVDENNNTI